MLVKTTHNVTACNNCPYIRTPVHDDPFTSEPYYGNSYNYKRCSHKEGPSYIADYRVIDTGCPLKVEADMKHSFKKELAPRRKATPCHECHLQLGERCDICGARAN